MSYLTYINYANATNYYIDRNIDEGRGNNIAFRYCEQTISYAGLFELVNKSGNLFSQSGIDYENRIILILPDCPMFVVAFFGLLRIGAVPVPLSPRLSLDDYLYVFADCRPKGLIVTRDNLPLIETMREEFASKNLPFPQLLWVVESNQNNSDYESFEISLDKVSNDCPVRMTKADDIALIQYTSGSTGIPKGVVHLHRGLINLCENVLSRLKISKDDVCFSAAKLSFGYGLGNSVFFPLSVGASSILFSGPVDAFKVSEIIKRGKPTIFFGVPTLYSAILNVSQPDRIFDFSSIRLFVSAGEHLTKQLFNRWKLKFGKDIIEGLGTTECLHIFICSEEGCIKPGSTGTPIENCEAILINDKNQEASIGEVGSLYVKTEHNASRYWCKQSESVKTMIGPWINTGDLCYQDEDGYFFYVGRNDDVIKIGGIKVLPKEVEECLETHESVRECAVVSLTSDDGTASISAYVCLKDNWEPTQKLKRELKKHLRKLISSYKIPRKIAFLDELPKTTTGKIARYKLR